MSFSHPASINNDVVSKFTKALEILFLKEIPKREKEKEIFGERTREEEAEMMNSNRSPSKKSESKSKSSSFFLENMEEIKRVFNRFDTNGDGKISSTDLSEVLKSLGSETTAEELKTMMDEIDKDGDGFIDLNEFTEFHRGGGKGSSSSKMISNDEDGVRELRDAFDMYDKDKNGLISATELHMVLKGLGDKCTVKDCSRMISSFDLDGDGSVNFDEFKKMMTNNKD